MHDAHENAGALINVGNRKVTLMYRLTTFRTRNYDQ